MRESVLEGGRMYLRIVLSQYYLVFLVTSRESEAQEVASLLLGAVNDAAAYHALAEAGLKSEIPVTENVQQAEKAVELDLLNVSYKNTYARLLYATGRKEEAGSTLIDLLDSEMSVKERELIQESLDLFGVEY